MAPNLNKNGAEYNESVFAGDDVTAKLGLAAAGQVQNDDDGFFWDESEQVGTEEKVPIKSGLPAGAELKSTEKPTTTSDNYWKRCDSTASLYRETYWEDDASSHNHKPNKLSQAPSSASLQRKASASSMSSNQVPNSDEYWKRNDSCVSLYRENYWDA